MIALNILAAKAKKTVLNVAPAGCGKSVACTSVSHILSERSKMFTSLTLAGLMRLRDEFEHYSGHIIIDDLGAEKSLWSKLSTITVLANLVYGHHVRKITQGYEIRIEDFQGSVSMNIQPVLMNQLVQSEEWIAVVRDKVIRYYHLIRPSKPNPHPPKISLDWGKPLNEVHKPKHKGKLYYQLVAIGLTQWSYARVEEHIPDLLRAAAALDNRTKVKTSDYKLLIKLLRPMQLERYIIDTYGFETGRVFNNNLYCVLVELASFREPTIEQICEDYKIPPWTAERIISEYKQWCIITDNSPKRVKPTDKAKQILELCGAWQKW